MKDGIDEYHELLTDELAEDSQDQLDSQLRARGLFFGDRPLCSVLRPRLLSPEQYRFLQQRAGVVLRAFRKAHDAALRDDTVLDQFGLEAWERELARVRTGFRDASPVSRLDAFFVDDGDGVRFTEYNAETPAGGAYNDALSEVFFGLRVVREFMRTWDLRPLPARHHVLHALLDAYAQFSGTRGRPRVAIVDWNDVPTRSEFLLFQDYFERQGLDCIVIDPRDVTYDGTSLRGAGGRIDLVYKRVLLTELVEREGMQHAIIRAVRDRAVCMVNPPSCKILHKKASLAVLHDERNAHLFSDDERQAIAASIPWTRVVTERRTAVDGKMVDLLPYIAEHREQLVLKPNDEYGGKGIVLGWEADSETWTAAIKTALAEPFIVQQRIPLPTEPYPSVVDGRVQVIERMVDTAPYVAYGDHVDGCLTRLATAALLNVTAGGGSQTPTFIAERRPRA
ncbi:MAG: circularly permuted type 2 ATP-grasp protein [Gemmatimonadaceae bacterium]